MTSNEIRYQIKYNWHCGVGTCTGIGTMIVPQFNCSYEGVPVEMTNLIATYSKVEFKQIVSQDIEKKSNVALVGV